MNVSVRELKNRLSEHLARVRRGERLVVTLRGRPIAEVGPPREGSLPPEERLARLVEEGDVRLPRGRGLVDIPPVRARGARVSDAILENRG